MTPYERQTTAIQKALEALDAAAGTACDNDDPEDVELFLGAARELRDAFNIPQPLYPAVLTMDATGFNCKSCGREESVCSADPCEAVIADRAA